MASFGIVIMDFKKYFWVIGLCFGVAFCQAETEPLLTEPESPLIESDYLPISVVPDLLVAPTEQGMLKTMKDLNNAALNKAILGVIAQILGAVLGVAIGTSLYYTYYGAKKGGRAMRNLFFPKAAIHVGFGKGSF